MENELGSSNPKPSKIPLEDMSKEDLIKQVKRQVILLQKTKHKCDELNMRCTTLEKEKNEAISLHNNSNLKDKIIELENKLSDITSEKDEATLAYTNIQAAQEEHLNKFQEYEKLLQESKTENHQLQRNFQQMKERAKELEKHCQFSEEQLECMKLKLDTLTTTCQYLQGDVEKLTSENKKLKNELQVMADARDEALKSLKLWKENMNKEIKDVEHLKGEIHILKIERNEFLSKVNDTAEIKENLAEKLHFSEEVNKNITEELKINQKQLEIAKNEIESYKLQIKQLSEKTNLATDSNENEDQKMDFEQLKQENYDLLTQIEELSKEKNDLNSKMESLLINLENVVKDKEIIIGNLRNVKQENETLKHELNELNNQMESFLNEQVNKNLKIANMEKELSKAIQQKLDMFEELVKVKDLQRFVEDEAKELKEENDKMKTEVKILEADLENDKLHIRKLENELHSAEEREHACTLEYEKLRTKLHELEKENELLNNDFNKQKKKLVSLDEISEKCISLESEKISLLIQIETLTQEINSLKSSNENGNTLKENETNIKNTNMYDSQVQTIDEIKESQESAILTEFKIENAILKQQIEQLNLKILEKEKLIESSKTLVYSNDSEETNIDKNFEFIKNSKLIQTEEICENNKEFQEFQLYRLNCLQENNHISMNINCSDELKDSNKEEELLKKIKCIKEESEEMKKSLHIISQERSILEKELENALNINKNLEENIKEINESKHLLEEKFQEKSNLVEKIHCQMDFLLNQIDDLNFQLQEKIKDLEVADSKLTDGKTKINLMQNELESYKTELETLKNEDYHLSNNCPLILNYKIMEEENKKHKEMYEYLQETNRELEKKINELEKVIENKDKTICLENDYLQKTVSEQINKLKDLEEENQEFKNSLISMNQKFAELENFEEKYIQYKTDNQFLKEENNKMQNKIEYLVAQLDEYKKETVKTLQEKTLLINEKSNHILMLEEQLISSKNEYENLKEAFEGLKEQLELTKQNLEKFAYNKDKQTQDSSIQTNDMEYNKHLKDIKAESLSKNYSEKNPNLNSELDVIKSTLDVDDESKIKNLEEEKFKLNQTIEKLLQEKNELLESINCKKQENGNQIESYDDNFKTMQLSLKESEDKMKKIKAVTLKTKRELCELKKQMNEITEERNHLKKKIEQIILEKEKAVYDCRQHLLNFQSLQTEYDKIEDKCEVMNSKIKQYEQDVTQLTSEVTLTKEKFVESKCENETLRKALDSAILEKKHLEQMKTELEGKVIVLESVRETETVKHEETKIEMQKKMQKVTELEEQLKLERLQHTSTTQQLEQALKEAKQQSLLSLEMADYERTVSELNANLEERSKCINDLRNQLENEKEKYSTVLEEIKHVECQWKAEENRAKNLKDILSKTKNELSDMKNKEQELKDKINSQQSHLESILQKEELFKVQISEISAENQKLYENLKDLRINSKRTTKSLETKIITLEEQLKIANSEIMNIRQQFESYKIRVHSVLKQKQESDSVHITQDETKQEMEKIIQQSREKIEELSEKLEVSLADNENNQKEHNQLLQHYEKLMEEAKLKDDYWNESLNQLKIERDTLHKQQESLTKQLQQQNVITETFKQRLNALQEKYANEVKLLQDQLEDAHSEIIQLQKEQQKTSSPTHLPEEPIHFDIFSQERQEGEGSECTDRRSITPVGNSSLNIIPSSGFMSFEQLLQMPNEPEAPSSISSHQDVDNLSSNLVAAKKKLEHLTELLNESEANNLRMTEQVRVLKEEIRRLERNKERETHAKNLEYLKNVVIKFVTLEGGDERIRLIPVLTTILRLSPEEQNQLFAISSGDSSSDNTSWSSYLHRWSGLI